MCFRFNLFLFITVLLGASFLQSEIIVQPQTTPQVEDAIVLQAGKRPIAPLSVALQELIQKISDKTFDKKFMDRIAKKEAEKFTGKYIERWDNGQIKIKTYFNKGKVDGHVHGWFSDGQEAFKAFFYENKKAGIHMAFFPSKTIIKHTTKRIGRILAYDYEGRLDGTQQSSYYDPVKGYPHNGNVSRLKSLSRYKQGVLHGKNIMYDPLRKCIKDEFYENGKLIPGKKTETKTRKN